MPANDSSTLDDVRILVSPTEAEFPVNGVELRAWAGSILDDNWKVKGECVLLVHRVLTLGEGVPGLEDREGDANLVGQVVDAIRATMEYPWTDDGPSVEEAGGDAILVWHEGERLWKPYVWDFGRWNDGTGKPAREIIREGTWRRMPREPHPASTGE